MGLPAAACGLGVGCWLVVCAIGALVADVGALVAANTAPCNPAVCLAAAAVACDDAALT